MLEESTEQKCTFHFMNLNRALCDRNQSEECVSETVALLAISVNSLYKQNTRCKRICIS